MSYEAWRISFQSSEQAAKAAFEDARKHHQMLLNTLTRCNELDANLQRIIEAATAEGPGPLTQAAIKEMPAHSLAQRDLAVRCATRIAFAKDTGNKTGLRNWLDDLAESRNKTDQIQTKAAGNLNDNGGSQ